MKDLLTAWVRNGTEADHYESPAGQFLGTLNPGFLVSVMFRDPEPYLRAVPPDLFASNAPLLGNFDTAAPGGWQIYRDSDGPLFNDQWELRFSYIEGGGGVVEHNYAPIVVVDPGVSDFPATINIPQANLTQLWHFAFGVLDTANIGAGRRFVAWHNGAFAPGGVAGSEFPVIASYTPAPATSALRVLAQQLGVIVGKDAEWFNSPLAIAGFGIAPLPVLAGETDFDALVGMIQRHTVACFAEQDFADDPFFAVGAGAGAYSARRGAYNLQTPWLPAERSGTPVQGSVQLTRPAGGVDQVAEATQTNWDSQMLYGTVTGP